MTIQRVATFITIEDGDKWQNGKIGTVEGHSYLSFIYQGAAKNRTGDNLESALVLAANQLSMNAVRDAVHNRTQVNVKTYLMNDSFDRQLNKLAEENWIAASMSFDTETIEVLLSSAIDAVGATTPNRVLTRDLVGALPVSATIYNR